jgi:hypothetical protein
MKTRCGVGMMDMGGWIRKRQIDEGKFVKLEMRQGKRKRAAQRHAPLDDLARP